MLVKLVSIIPPLRTEGDEWVTCDTYIVGIGGVNLPIRIVTCGGLWRGYESAWNEASDWGFPIMIYPGRNCWLGWVILKGYDVAIPDDEHVQNEIRSSLVEFLGQRN